MSKQRSYVTGSEFPPLKPDTLRVYSMRLCPYAQRALLVMNYKNIKYETININLVDKPEWYLKLNPFGKVPTVQVNDNVVYESLVVCEYLDAVFPGEKVVPTDPYQLAKDRMLIESFSQTISNYYGFLTAKDDDTMKGKVKNLVKGFQTLENDLKLRNSKFFGGDRPMLVDFAIWPHFERMLILKDLDPSLAITKEAHPLLTAWTDVVKALPAVECTLNTPDIHKKFFASFTAGRMACDLGIED